MESKSLKSVSAKKGNRTKGIALVMGATLCTASGITLLKIGITSFNFTFWSLINAPLIGGVLLYIVSAALLMLGLKEGNLSTLYPVIALSYVWVLIISVVLFEEPLSAIKAIGSLAIVGGVSLLGFKGD